MKKNSRSIFYPFQLSYWRGYTRPVNHQVNGASNEGSPENLNANDAFEDEPTDKPLGIQLKNVSKVNHRTTKQKLKIYSLIFSSICRLTHFFFKNVHLLMLYVMSV